MPHHLFDLLIVAWINFMLNPIPLKLKSTFTELFIGQLLDGSGHISGALLAVGHLKNFSTYYRFLEVSQWSWLNLAKQLVRLIIFCFPRTEWSFIIDDFICTRTSKHAPNGKWLYEHCQKPNRPRYIWGQQWVSLGLALSWGKMIASLPILLRLHKAIGNRTKLTTAVTLIRAVLPEFKKIPQAIFRCLVDSWYMRAPFILPLLKRGLHVIGQVRKDTALFFEPHPTTSMRGRPRKYGKKIIPILWEKLPLCSIILNIYGGNKLVKFRATICLARFLRGQKVMAVWCQLPDQKDWTLIISTDLTLSSPQIIKLFARRWKIEPMFNEIKHSFGIANAWQQTTRTLQRWVTVCCVSYSLTRMLSLIFANRKRQKYIPQVQWRIGKPVTAGLVRLGLQIFFRYFTFSALWDAKSKKLILKNQQNLILKC